MSCLCPGPTVSRFTRKGCHQRRGLPIAVKIQSNGIGIRGATRIPVEAPCRANAKASGGETEDSHDLRSVPPFQPFDRSGQPERSFAFGGISTRSRRFARSGIGPLISLLPGRSFPFIRDRRHTSFSCLPCSCSS